MEKWNPVVGYEGLYEVSNYGRIKSLPRRREKLAFHMKKQVIHPKNKGYAYVSLYKNNKAEYALVHRVVATSFVENLYNKPNVNHKDCDRLNNHTDNLEWCTQKENILHAVKNDRLARGEYRFGHKLQPCNILQIRKMIKDRITIREIAVLFGVSTSTIFKISVRKKWAHIL